MNKQAVRAMARLFLDDDTTRQITGHQPVARDGRPPIPGYERILKVTCPIDIERSTDHHDRTYWDTSLDEARLNQLEPFTTDYLPYDELYNDGGYQVLPTWLLHDVPDLNGPQLTGSGRQLVNVDDPLLADLTDTGVDPDRLDRLEPVLDAHERDPTARGSHADTILNHRSRSAETISGLRGQLRLVTPADPEAVPSQSGVFQELMAILSERRVAPHLPERHALDALRRATGGETYSLALDILEWLRTDLPRRLSYSQITDLLHYCRFTVCPDRMLAHVLADLSHGMPPEDIPYHSSYFDRTISELSPSDLYSRHDEAVQESVDRPFRRLMNTTFETIRLEGDSDARRLVKEWWSYDPPAVVPPEFIRLILLLRRLHQHATHNGYSLVLSTASTGGLGSDSSPAAYYRYQDDDPTHPLREAMDRADPPDLTRLENRLRGVCAPRFEDGSAAVKQVWQDTKRDWLSRQDHFNDDDDIKDWIAGAAPADSSLVEVCQYYL